MNKNEIEKDVERRMKKILKIVQAQWGHGWPRLGVSIQRALVRSEMLREISIFNRTDLNINPADAVELTEALAFAAIQWNDEEEAS